MATNRPFARNLGANIAGTEQIGNLAIGIPTSGFAETGLTWYGGPDEELGYVVAKDNPDGQSAADGTTAYLGFWRSSTLTDASFIELGNNLLSANYTTTNEVKTALNAAGFWTSYGLGGGEGSFQLTDYKLSTMYAPAPNNGDITFPGHPAVGGAPGQGATNPNLVGTTVDSYSYQLYINPNDINGNDNSALLDQLIGASGTLTLTQGNNSVTYSFTDEAFKVGNVGIGSGMTYFYDTLFGVGGPIGQSPVGSLTVLTPATADFNTIDPITITLNSAFANAITTSNDEYIEVGENQYLAYNN